MTKYYAVGCMAQSIMFDSVEFYREIDDEDDDAYNLMWEDFEVDVKNWQSGIFLPDRYDLVTEGELMSFRDTIDNAITIKEI